MPTQVDDELEKYAAKSSSDDDELEKYAQKAKPASGSLDEYLSKPFDASGSVRASDDLESKVEKENLTPRMRAAVSSGAAKMQPPTRFEKEHTPAPEDTGVWNRLKQYGGDVGRMASGIPEMLFSNPVATPGRIADIATGYAKRAVPNTSQEGLSGARSPVYNALATGAQAVGVADPASMEASAEHGDPAGVLTHTAAQLTPIAAGEAARIPAVRKAAVAVADTARAIPNIPDKVALALRTEEGAVHPAVTRTVGAIGGAGGAALGHYLGVPEAGAIAGYGIGTAAADRLIPNLPHDIPTKTPIGATLPSAEEFYENKGVDLLKRGKEQASIDKATEREQTAQEKALAKEGKAVPITQGPYYNQHLEDLKAQAEAEQAAQESAKPKIVPAISTVGEPQIPKTGSEGTAARFTNETVKELAPWGDPDAIEQARQRGYGKLPLKYSSLTLNPKSVTRFGPSGEVIEELQRPAEAPEQEQPIAAQGRIPVIDIPLRHELPGTIPTISRTPRGSIPNIGEAPPKGAALPFPGPLPETSTPIAAKPPTEATPEPVAAAEQPKTAKDRSARIAKNIASLEQGLGAKAGKIPSIGQPQTGAFKVPALKPIVPPDLEPVLRDSGWSYKGKDASGMHTIEEPGTHIKVRLLDRDLNPEFVRRKIAEKEKQFGGPETSK